MSKPESGRGIETPASIWPCATADGGSLTGFTRLFLGSSLGACKVRDAVRRAAKMDLPVLVIGESGAGKELVAREIHLRSERSHEAFVPLNCAAIPDTLIESELFGHEAGAYTDAHAVRRGYFEMAHRGTLFLDEIGDLSPTAQPKLLRALETGEVFRVGSESPRPVDVRIIAATNHNLGEMTKERKFRADLYYRIRILEISIPPLRDRQEDIEELAEHFARLITRANNREFREITPSAMELLRSYSWPGNVRELRSVVERAIASSSGPLLDAACFTLDPSSGVGLEIRSYLQKDWKTARRRFESAYVNFLLTRFKGDVRNAARAAGLAPRSLYKMLKRLGLRPDRWFS